jgi:hypothetical protein
MPQVPRNSRKATSEFVEAFEAEVKSKRTVRDRKHKNVTLDPAFPEKAMKFYYQVRSTAVHTGKVGADDYDILRESTTELLEIFKRVRDEVFRKSEDEN